MSNSTNSLDGLSIAQARAKHNFDFISALYARAENETIGYIAAPLDTYRTDDYRNARKSAFERWPDVHWIQPAELDWTNDEWLALWPRIVPVLVLLAVVPRADGTIGRGVWDEALTCLMHSVPVVARIDANWQTTFTLERLAGDSWRRYARVVSNGAQISC